MPAYTPIYTCKLVREKSVPTRPRLNGTEKALAVCNEFLSDSPCEQMITVLLDSNLRVIGVVPITTGVLNQTMTHPREVFRPAIIHNCASIIVAHNHPSGNLKFSNADYSCHTILKKAGEVLGIKVLDFIIVDGEGNSLSMEEFCKS